jgi:nucleoside-diphosphate-sugar epimerase
MCEHIAAAVGKPVRKLRAPMAPFTLLAILMEQTLGRVGIQPPLHRRRLDFFRKSFFFSPAERNGLLEWRPRVTFHEGARQAAEWYMDNGFLATR